VLKGFLLIMPGLENIEFLEKENKFQTKNKHSGNTLLVFCSTAFFIDDGLHNRRQTRNAIVNELFWESFSNFENFGVQSHHFLSTFLQSAEIDL
jgi:hypothetical protein